MAFSQQGPRTVCILSANGAICNVTLRQPAMAGGNVTYEVLFSFYMLFRIHSIPVYSSYKNFYIEIICCNICLLDMHISTSMACQGQGKHETLCIYYLLACNANFPYFPLHTITMLLNMKYIPIFYMLSLFVYPTETRKHVHFVGCRLEIFLSFFSLLFLPSIFFT